MVATLFLTEHPDICIVPPYTQAFREQPIVAFRMLELALDARQIVPS
jgi:hypothetical protein